MNKRNILSAILSILLAGGALGGYKVVRDNRASTFEYSLHPVISVIDGDTIKIEDGKKIRLLGIDAPEKDGCYYEEAREYLKSVLAEKDITIRKDVSGSDRFDRLLRYVFIPAEDPEEDDIFINEELVREGYAITYAIAPDTQYRDLFASAQEEAKKYQRGLWGACEQEEKESATLREEDSAPHDPSCLIKGNISEKGYGKNYFLASCPNYQRIKVDAKKGEAYFCSEEEAQEAGFTRSASCDNTF